jgi:hypothetical protein
MNTYNNNRIKRIITYSLITLISSYALYQAHFALIGPEITVDAPTHGATYITPLIDVRGTVQNSSIFRINNQIVYANNKGEFSYKLLLHPGYNIIVLEAVDKFGSKDAKQIDVVFKE